MYSKQVKDIKKYPFSNSKYIIDLTTFNNQAKPNKEMTPLFSNLKFILQKLL